MEQLLRRGYESFTQIDTSGQSRLYKTLKNGHIYAIKVVAVINPETRKVDSDLARELSIVKHLRHPNLLRVEEMFRTRAKMYIISDYLPNGSIGTTVRKNGPLCEWNSKLWFCSVARAIKYLHQQSIAHR